MVEYILAACSLLICITCNIATPIEADSCTISNYNDVAAAARRCNVLIIKDLVIPVSTTLLIELKDGAKLVFDGHLTHQVAEWKGDLVHIKGNNVEVYGTPNHLLDGLGQKHWKGANEPIINRPKFIRVQLQHSTVRDLKIKNCPNNCMVLSHSDHLVVQNIHIDNHDGYPGVAGTHFAKNTDGFDVVATTNLRVENSVVINQDDCVAINSGHDMIFDNLQCNGSHGLSFSVRDTEVYGIQFLNSRVTDASNAIHVKTHNDGSTGLIRDILYKNIEFSGIERYAISVQENYPKGEAKANIPIRNFTLDHVTGSMKGRNSMALQIICASGGCDDWHFNEVKITGARNKNTCEHVPKGISC